MDKLRNRPWISGVPKVFVQLREHYAVEGHFKVVLDSFPKLLRKREALTAMSTERSRVNPSKLGNLLVLAHFILSHGP